MNPAFPTLILIFVIVMVIDLVVQMTVARIQQKRERSLGRT